MRRLISVLAAAALVATPLATAGAAMAKDHHDGGGRAEPRGRGDGGRAPGRGAPAPQVWRGEDRGGRAYRGYPEAGRWERSDPRYDRRAEPRYEPRAYAPPPGAYGPAPRRGGFLPQGGPVIEDPGRYRLRAPPRGYDWVQTPGGMALVNRSDGRVYDVVPN